MWIYIRYYGTHLLILLTVIGLLLGESASWLGLVVGVLGWIGCDALSPRAKPVPNIRHPRVLDFALHSFVPSVAALSIVFAWYLSPHDLFGIGSAVDSIFGYPALAHRAANHYTDYVGAILSVGLAIALGGILTAHELMHRTTDARAMFSARWLLAMAFNASLEVAHVFGHHRDVATVLDPATARRGENVYGFYVRSSLGQVAQAWRIEMERLRDRAPIRALVLDNKVTRGFMRSATVAWLYWWAAGLTGVTAFLMSALFNKLLLEALNYLEHYGLVRLPGAPYALRHAWDTDRAVSQIVLINLPMHSEHHLEPRTHFESLRARPDETPLLPCGYLAALALTLVPPLWNKVMAPKLAEWDKRFATPDEWLLAHGCTD